MDKIKEVMGLVKEYGDQRSFDCHYDEDLCGDVEAINLKKAIESKLRALLEREPLRDRRIGEIAVECDDGQEGMEYLIAFARAIERAHGIGNDSKGM